MRLLIGIMLLAAGAAQACEVKLVFNRWCLGASIEEQLGDAKINLDKTEHGVRRVFTTDDAGRTVMVSSFDGRISGVSRLHMPGTSLVYTDLRTALVQLYGPGEDRSRFPAYADNWDTRATTIALGKGRASHTWKQPGWWVSLSWSSRKSVYLGYNHEELAARAAKAKPSDL